MSSHYSLKLATTLLTILDCHENNPPTRIDALVETIDLAIVREVLNGADHAMATQTLARSVVAVGTLLLPIGDSPRISATLKAAGAYVENPTDETMQTYFDCATNSYPYGPGDGHYGLPGCRCEAGSGCASGAGTLRCAAEVLGHETVLHLLRDTLQPWLCTHASVSPLCPPRGGRDDA